MGDRTTFRRESWMRRHRIPMGGADELITARKKYGKWMWAGLLLAGIFGPPGLLIGVAIFSWAKQHYDETIPETVSSD